MAESVIDISEQLFQARLARSPKLKWFMRRLVAVEEFFQDEPGEFDRVLEAVGDTWKNHRTENPWDVLPELERVVYERIAEQEEATS